MPPEFGPPVPRDFANAPTTVPIAWPGSGSNPIGKTALGIFADDDAFIDAAPRVAKYVCTSLGYPIVDVELTDEQIYIQFEKAIMEFSALVNEFNMREQMMSLQGVRNDIVLTGKLIRNTPLPYIVEMSQIYGTEANVGGLVDFYKAGIPLIGGQQDYDLQELYNTISGSAGVGARIEIRRVWHERPPAMGRFFDPFAGGAGQGLGIQNMLGQFGWGNYAVASQYLLMPMYETLLRVQAIELNDQIRRSQFSFELKNNKIRIFPIPDNAETGLKLWFEYLIKQDKFDSVIGQDPDIGADGVVSDFSNAKYDYMLYAFINDVGRNWILKYTLALCKIVLGNNRSKYDTIPIPNSEIRLDGLTLRQEGQQEREELVQLLRETLEETGKTAQMEKAAQNEENSMDIMRKVPMKIYVR